MMMNVTAVFIALVVFFCTAVTRPGHARCPEGMWLPEGVRDDGNFVCRPKPVGGDHWNGHAWVDDSVVPDGEVESRVYCTGGQIPVITDGIAVSCQARH